MATIIGANIYIDIDGTYVKHNTDPVPLEGQQYDISDVKSMGSAVSVKATYVYDDGTESDFSNINSFNLEFSKVLVPGVDISSSTVLWGKPQKSSEWPEVTTAKPYFILWGTSHDSGAGGIFWGEFDSFSGDTLFGFVERGVIITGYQAESPWLIRIPTAKSGISEEIFLYYHTQLEPGHTGSQETRLKTTTGGVLHTATWTDRGRPLGIYNDDDHTGYARVFENDAGDYIAPHLTVGGASPKSYFSKSTDGGLSFTRMFQKEEAYVNLPDGLTFAVIAMEPFKYNVKNYAFIAVFAGEPDAFLAIAEVDQNFVPTVLIKKVVSLDNLGDVNLYIENNIAYLLLKEAASDTASYSFFKYNLLNDTSTVDDLSSPEIYSNEVKLEFTPVDDCYSYEVYIDGVLHATQYKIEGKDFYVTGLTLGQTYDIQIRPVDLVQRDLSNSIQITTADNMIAQYQNVLDYATTNGITHPDTTENTRRNNIMKKLVISGAYNELTTFLDLKGTAPAAFRRICFKRCIEVPEYNSPTWLETGVEGTDTGYIDLLINPSDADKFAFDDASIGVRLVENRGTILGGRTSAEGTQQVYWYSPFGGTTVTVTRLFDNSDSIDLRVDGEYYHVSAIGTSRKFFVDGVLEKVGTSSIPAAFSTAQYLLAMNNNGSLDAGNLPLVSHVYYGSSKLENHISTIKEIMGVV